jgi:hypothetical protein
LAAYDEQNPASAAFERVAIFEHKFDASKSSFAFWPQTLDCVTSSTFEANKIILVFDFPL